MKVLGVTGKMLETHEGQSTQDFVFVNGKAFPNRNAVEFLQQLKFMEKHITDSQALKQIVSTTARLAEEALEVVGSESAALAIRRRTFWARLSRAWLLYGMVSTLPKSPFNRRRKV